MPTRFAAGNQGTARDFATQLTSTLVPLQRDVNRTNLQAAQILRQKRDMIMALLQEHRQRRDKRKAAGGGGADWVGGAVSGFRKGGVVGGISGGVSAHNQVPDVVSEIMSSSGNMLMGAQGQQAGGRLVPNNEF